MYVLPTGDVIYEMVEYDRPSVCHWLESSLKEHHSNFNQHFTISIYFQKKTSFKTCKIWLCLNKDAGFVFNLL